MNHLTSFSNINNHGFFFPSTPLERQRQVIEEFCAQNNIPNQREEDPLMFAIYNKNAKLCGTIIDLEADLEVYDKQGFTPLGSAIYYGFAEGVAILLEAGANPNGKVHSLPLLHLAVLTSHLEISKLLLEYGADIEATDIRPLSPFIIEQFARQTEEQGIPFDPVATENMFLNGMHATALHFACESTFEIAELLIHHRAKINVENASGMGPLDIALHNKNEKLCQLLCSFSAENPLYHQNSRGWTPLFFQIASGNIENVERLIRLGADVNQKNAKGDTPLYCATLFKQRKIIRLLINHGAAVCTLSSRCLSPLFNIWISGEDLNVYPELLAKDGGFTEKLIRLRLIGHKFSLHEDLYSGLPIPVTFKALATTVDSFVKLNPHTIPAIYHQTVPVILNALDKSMTAQNYIDKVKRGEIIALNVASINHSLSAVIYQDKIALGNQGLRLKQLKPGIRFYKIHAMDSLEEGISLLMKTLQDNLKYDAHDKKTFEEQKAEQQTRKILFFEEGIHEVLKLEEVFFKELSDQKTGNCGWKAAKMTLRSIEILFFGDCKIYKQISLYDRQRSIQNIPYLENDPLLKDIVSWEDMYRDLVFCCAKRTQEFVCRQILSAKPHLVNANDPYSGQSLLSRAMISGSRDLVSFILKLKTDLNFIEQNVQVR